MSITIYAILLAGAFGLLFLLAELLHRKLHMSAEATRKLVHFGTGLLTLLFPMLLPSVAAVGLLCGGFLILLLASMRYKQLPSINAIERKSWGSILYPVIVFICFAFYDHYAHAANRLFEPLYYFYLPVLVMAICDPIAALAGHAFRKQYPQTAPGKTLAGSFAFFFAAAVLITGVSAFFHAGTAPASILLMIGIMLAFMSTLAERFSAGGWDNFTIPLSIIAGMQIMETGLSNFAG